MFCGISGETPKDPVLAKTSGQIYERSLIQKYISANGKCPITGEPLSEDDLITVKVNKAVKPRQLTATSIPGMLQAFQNEWDALVLESFTLRQQLDATRQELAHALYQNDAACRVIARLIRERDEAKSALGNLQATATSSAGSMEVAAERDITPAVIERMEKLQGELSKTRKSRPCNIVPKPTIEQFSSKSSVSLHKTTQPGITSVSIHPIQKQRVLTGGMDKTLVVYDRNTGKKQTAIAGHTKKINRVLFHPVQDLLLSASEDKTARVWTPSGANYRVGHVITPHTGGITGLTLHPLGDYFVTASSDGTWAFNDIHTGVSLAHINDAAAFVSSHFHPDGLLLGTSDVNGLVQVWDVKSQKSAVKFNTGSNPVQFAFSENGYNMVSLTKDDAKLWDVRKPNPLKTYDFAPGFNGTSVDIDFSGTYVAFGGADVRVFTTKTLEPVVTFEQHKNTVTDVQWTRDSFELASVSIDRTLKFYSA